MNRTVRVIAGAGCWSEPGSTEEQVIRNRLPERKHARWMAHSVQLGVVAVRDAVALDPGFESVPPERRGLFVGTSPPLGEPDDLVPALELATEGGIFDLQRFGELGFPLVPPLWLVRGLTNNVVGFASAYFDVRGPNTTHTEGAAAGLRAILDGIAAVAEGRVDRAIVGGADDWRPFNGLIPGKWAEGAAFLILAPGDTGWEIRGRNLSSGKSELPYWGAATGPVALVDAWRRRELASVSGFDTEKSGVMVEFHES